MAEQTGEYVDPYRAYNFKIEIQGSIVGHFTQCSGMEVKVHPIAYRESGNSQVVHYVPGQVEYSPITLHYGLTESRDLWNWFMTGVQGKVERRNLSIVLTGSDGVSEVTRWNLFHAWPTAWTGPLLETTAHEVAIESLTLVCETLERASA